MPKPTSATAVDANQREALNALAIAVIPALFWLPWARAAALVQLIGCVLMVKALGGLASIGPRMAAARVWTVAAAVAAAIGVLAGDWPLFFRLSYRVAFPWTFHIEDYLLGVAFCLIAGVLLDRAAAAQNIALRDAIAARRNLILAFLLAEGIAMGPLTLLFYSKIIGEGMYRCGWAVTILINLAAIVAWNLILNRVAKGFKSEDFLSEE
jgi:hypothetical protein